MTGCNVRLDDFFAAPVVTVCTRPAGHDGPHWPVPMAGDGEEVEDQ